MSDAAKLALPPPTIPSCKALGYALLGWMGSDWAAAKFITTYGADVMADVALAQREVTLANGMAATYWVREGARAPGAAAAAQPAIIVLPGLREKVFPAARLAQTLGMPTATVYVVDLPTCGGHCEPVVGERSDPVPAGAFTRHPVRVASACELLKGLLDHLGLANRTSAGGGFVLLGFSTGAHVAYSFAARHAAALPLRGLGLIHPAGHCLADSLLDLIAAAKMDDFPFAFEVRRRARRPNRERRQHACSAAPRPGAACVRAPVTPRTLTRARACVRVCACACAVAERGCLSRALLLEERRRDGPGGLGLPRRGVQCQGELPAELLAEPVRDVVGGLQAHRGRASPRPDARRR